MYYIHVCGLRSYLYWLDKSYYQVITHLQSEEKNILNVVIESPYKLFPVIKFITYTIKKPKHGILHWSQNR